MSDTEAEEVVVITLAEQFVEFAKFMDDKERDGTTINLYRSDYWLRQGKVLEDRKLTMTDTGIAWWKFQKIELTYDEWYEFLSDICSAKEMDQQTVEDLLTNCGLPGVVSVHVPQYRDFFDTFKQSGKLRY